MKDRFDFQQFSVRQDRCAMKVGTDGVLLGAWAALPPSGRVLDAGCGTGLISLMAAQRTACRVVGVEIDAEAAAQAAENAAASPWAERIAVVCCDLRHFVADAPFDAVLSNPPYYDSSLPSPDSARSVARHTAQLTFADLTRTARRLLRPGGQLHVVLPLSEEQRFLTEAAAAGFYPCRRTVVVTRRPKPPRRVLLSLGERAVRAQEDELVLMDDNGSRSAAYSRLTADFYVH